MVHHKLETLRADELYGLLRHVCWEQCAAVTRLCAASATSAGALLQKRWMFERADKYCNQIEQRQSPHVGTTTRVLHGENRSQQEVKL